MKTSPCLQQQSDCDDCDCDRDCDCDCSHLPPCLQQLEIHFFEVEHEALVAPPPPVHPQGLLRHNLAMQPPLQVHLACEGVRFAFFI
eukprot:7244214-Pyramimonas_sp.AAC.1